MNHHNTFTPKKSLGQNFLINDIIAERIVEACQITPTDSILEIGPGKGALTHMLSQKSKSVIAVEKDNRLSRQLIKDFYNSNVQIFNEDILRFPFAKLPDNCKIVGNLPYNTATPIIKKIIEHRKKFQKLFITVQLEYGQRIAAKPNTKSYGSFSCFIQYYMIPKILFKIKNSAFSPVPKVQSCFLCLDFLKKPKTIAKNEKFLFSMIRSCFNQRRKIILNSLATSIDKENIPHLLRSLDIDPILRAENLSLDDYVRISNTVEKMLL